MERFDPSEMENLSVLSWAILAAASVQTSFDTELTERLERSQSESHRQVGQELVAEGMAGSLVSAKPTRDGCEKSSD